MIGFLKLILCFCVYFMVLNTAECQVTITNLNGTGTFLCGHDITLQCAIPGYVDGMSWTSDGTIIAHCLFGSCTALDALPSGDIFIANETAKLFNLIIGITHADNGKQYKCDDGLNQDQTTVNIQVPPLENEFTPDITETPTSITVEAGCFYPSDAGRMDVYCVSDTGTEVLVEAAVTMTPTTTGCSGDCAGPNIYTATGNIIVESSNTGGTSAYRFKIYHEDYKQHAISIDSSAIYNCGVSTTLPTTVTQTTPTSNTTGQSTSPPTSGPDCGRTCIIIIVACVVVLFIIIIIVCWCIRKRKQKKDAKNEMNDTKQDQNNKPSRESDYNKINEKKQDQNKMEHKL